MTYHGSDLSDPWQVLEEATEGDGKVWSCPNEQKAFRTTDGVIARSLIRLHYWKAVVDSGLISREFPISLLLQDRGRCLHHRKHVKPGKADSDSVNVES